MSFENLADGLQERLARRGTDSNHVLRMASMDEPRGHTVRSAALFRHARIRTARIYVDLAKAAHRFSPQRLEPIGEALGQLAIVNEE